MATNLEERQLTGLIAQLRANELLAGIDDDHLDRIAAVATTQTLELGETLVAEGSLGADLFFVRSGSFAATVLNGSTPTEVGRLGPGDMIGETQLIAGGRRTATVRAREKSVVLLLPQAEFDALMAVSEPLRAALAKVIHRRLREAALRVALPPAVGSDPELLDLLSDQAAWVQLARGEVLWEEGESADSWYVLVSGELSIVEDKHGVRREIRAVRHGEVIGEIALICSAPRSATIMASRDSWLARFDARLLNEQILTRTEALQTLVRTLTGRLSATSRPSADFARVFTLLPRDLELDTQGFVDSLFESLGANVLVVDPAALRREGVVGDAEQMPSDHPGWMRFESWVELRRQDAGCLLLITDGRDNPWTRAAIAQADTILLLADADADPAGSDIEQILLDPSTASRSAPVWLVLEHPFERTIPQSTASWLNARTVQHHAHVRRGHTRDVARLARWLTGRTVGIALSGGGARGFVHLGVAAAMHNFGFEVDLIAGTSAGAMAGGLWARDEAPELFTKRAFESLAAQGNPLAEFDLPLISLLRSRRLRDGLCQLYGEMEIEDSWIPLRIVATDLTESRRTVFKRGLVWQRTLASSSPPGIMPPVKDGNRLLCDGGLIDNLPVSVLIEEHCKVKIASYIGSNSTLPAPRSDFPGSWTLLLDKILRRRRHEDVPTILRTLLQCLSVPATTQLEIARSATDIFFEPDLSAFSVSDFSAAAAMFKAGQTHAREVLDERLSELDLARP